MPIEITGLYASLLAIIMIVLSTRVSLMRAKSPFGVNADNANRAARRIGAVLTTASLLISIAFILIHAF